MSNDDDDLHFPAPHPRRPGQTGGHGGQRRNLRRSRSQRGRIESPRDRRARRRPYLHLAIACAAVIALAVIIIVARQFLPSR